MIDDELHGRLLPGETIVWSGRPGQGLVFTGSDIFMIPFSVVWCTIAFTSVLGPAGTSVMPNLIGLLFVGIGLYFVVGRFLLDMWLRANMRYAVTDRRILIIRPAPFRVFTAITLAQLLNVHLNERADGRGTVRFGQATSMFGNRGIGASSPALDPTPQFIAIDDARRVFDLVQRSRHHAM